MVLLVIFCNCREPMALFFLVEVLKLGEKCGYHNCCCVHTYHNNFLRIFLCSMPLYHI
jgi:hypothetical protein